MTFSSYPLAQYKAHKKEINQKIEGILNSGNYILGQEVTNFENSFSKYCDVKYTVGVNSGTDAILLALKALNIGIGDEVITVSHTALATLSAIISSGATPVIADVDKDFLNINTDHLSKLITKKTKAIIPVHIYGQSCDMKNIIKIARKNNLYIIEDCAQAVGASFHGKKVGSLGDIGAFSFYPTKNLGAVGDGGCITTNNKKIAEKVRRLRQFGWNDERTTSYHGLSSRLDEIQAAILNVKLKYLESDNNKRVKLASIYYDKITNSKIFFPQIRNNCRHVYHLFVVITDKRELILNELKKNNIYCGIHYPTPAHLHKGYKSKCKFNSKDLSNTNKICKKIFSLPMYPELEMKEIKKVINIINNMN